MSDTSQRRDVAEPRSLRHRKERAARTTACAEETNSMAMEPSILTGPLQVQSANGTKSGAKLAMASLHAPNVLVAGLNASRTTALRSTWVTWKGKWKTEAAKHISQLQSAVASLLERGELPPLATFGGEGHPNGARNKSSQGDSAEISAAMPMDMTRENSSERQDVDEGLVPAPMNSLYELTKVRNLRSDALLRHRRTSINNDFIARGIIHIDVAEHLFARFVKNHQPLLWGGIHFPYRTLSELRSASMLLTSAVVTVSVLHSREHSHLLQKSYDVFVSQVSDTWLVRHDSLDDVRALCLGAFYLPNICWRLSGQAVRAATEMSLHHSFQRLLRGPESHRQEHHARVRLWYILYVCDRHFSIAYGRPPAAYDEASVNGVEQFLQSPYTTQGDIRLSAQVALFQILTEANTSFGNDQETPLTEAELKKLRAYNVSFEQWRLLWEPRSLDNPDCGTYPSKGVVLYYNFARFQLNSLSLRGIHWPITSDPSDPISGGTLSLARREAVNCCLSSAISTLTVVLEETDLRKALVGVPLFTHTMIAFCATFLLKMAAIWRRREWQAKSLSSTPSSLAIGFNVDEVLWLTQQTVEMLEEVAADLSETHLVRNIVVGIREMLQRMAVPSRRGSGASQNQALRSPFNQQGFARPGEFARTQQVEGDFFDMTAHADLSNIVGLLEFGFDDVLLDQLLDNDPSTWPPST